MVVTYKSFIIYARKLPISRLYCDMATYSPGPMLLLYWTVVTVAMSMYHMRQWQIIKVLILIFMPLYMEWGLTYKFCIASIKYSFEYLYIANWDNLAAGKSKTNFVQNTTTAYNSVQVKLFKFLKTNYTLYIGLVPRCWLEAVQRMFEKSCEKPSPTCSASWLAMYVTSRRSTVIPTVAQTAFDIVTNTTIENH